MRLSQGAQPRVEDGIPETCAALAQSVFAKRAKATATTQSIDVAEAVW